jgi:hypothetical protein
MGKDAVGKRRELVVRQISRKKLEHNHWLLKIIQKSQMGIEPESILTIKRGQLVSIQIPLN